VVEAADRKGAARLRSSTPDATLRVLLVDVSDRGGIARYSQCLRAALRDAGVSVSLAAPAGLADDGLALAARRWGPDVSDLPRWRVFGLRLAEVAPSALLLTRAVVRSRCDVVHVQSEVVPRLDPLLLRAVARRVPVVVTAHDPDPLEGGPRALARQARRWRAADAVIIHGEGPRRLVEENAPGVPVYVVPVDLPLGGAGMPRADARRRLGLDDGPMALLLGLLRPYKGLGLLADAWPRVTAEVPGATLRLVGDAYPCAELERLERTGAVDVRPGFIDESELDCWAAAADVVVLPYLRGSHSGILHRALAVGTPVLASPPLAEEAARTGAGPVVDLSPEAWADALVEALTGRRPPPPPAPAGRDTATGTLAVYRDVLDRRARRRMRGDR
jgi:glycosyltransferase involved in cell wall biosynthesis